MMMKIKFYVYILFVVFLISIVDKCVILFIRSMNMVCLDCWIKFKIFVKVVLKVDSGVIC